MAHGAVAAPMALLTLLVHHEALDDACAVAPLAFAVAVAPHTCAHVPLLGVFGWQNFVASSKALLTLEDARRNGQKYEGAAVPGIHVLREPAASRYQKQATGTRGGVGLVDQTLIAANYL